MPFRRRRPLLRAAAVGGAAYHAGKKVQEGRDQDAVEEAHSEGGEDAPAQPQGVTPETMTQLERLAELKDRGVLTQEEFEAEKRKLLG